MLLPMLLVNSAIPNLLLLLRLLASTAACGPHTQQRVKLSLPVFHHVHFERWLLMLRLLLLLLLHELLLLLHGALSCCMELLLHQLLLMEAPLPLLQEGLLLLLLLLEQVLLLLLLQLLLHGAIHVIAKTEHGMTTGGCIAGAGLQIL